MGIKAILQRAFKPKEFSSNSATTKKTEGSLRLKVKNSIAKLRQKFNISPAEKEKIEANIEKINDKLQAGYGKKIQAIFRRFVLAAKPENIQQIHKKLPKMNRGAVKKVWSQVQALLKMIRDPQTAWASKALAIGTLVYLISPLDAIPDIIPGVGLADDVALIVAVVSSLAYELGNYVEKSANKGVEVASQLADIQVEKYNKIVRITLIGSILTATITIAVKFFLNQMA